jgi:putative hydrolase of the HAD superfamily
VPDASRTTATAVLFDLDETLVPLCTPVRWQWAWRPNGPVLSDRHVRAAIRRELHNWDRRRWHGVVGSERAVTAGDYLELLRAMMLAVADRPLPDDEVAMVVDRFVRPIGPAEQFSDVAPALRQLASLGLPYAIVSALPAGASRPFLHRVGLDERRLVEAPADALPVPDRAAFRRAAAFLGVPPAQVVFVGDLYWSDVRAATRAGLQTVLIDREGHTPPAAGRRIASLAELPEAIARGPSQEEPAADASPGP